MSPHHDRGQPSRGIDVDDARQLLRRYGLAPRTGAPAEHAWLWVDEYGVSVATVSDGDDLGVAVEYESEADGTRYRATMSNPSRFHIIQLLEEARTDRQLVSMWEPVSEPLR